MEKRVPHCKLSLVHALVKAGRVRTTQAAREGATLLDFDQEQMLAVIMALTTSNFYKSMTTHHDHTLWQDVYHASASMKDIYLKLMVMGDVLIVSFKEL